MARQRAAARAKFVRDALAAVRAKLAGAVSADKPLSVEAQVQPKTTTDCAGTLRACVMCTGCLLYRDAGASAACSMQRSCILP